MIQINFNSIRGADIKRQVRDAANFFMNELLSSRKSKNTHLEIRFIKLPKNIHGYCCIHEDDYNPNNPTMFSIDISPTLTLEKIITTLAHELVHLRQFREKQLKYRDKYTLFRGYAYSLDTPYEKEPWEKEAYKLEKSLVKKFTKVSNEK